MVLHNDILNIKQYSDAKPQNCVRLYRILTEVNFIEADAYLNI